MEPEVVAAIVGGVGVVLGALIAIWPTLRERREIHRRESRPDSVVADDIFDFRPVQKSGENVFTLRELDEEAEGLQEFFVKVHFHLWTRYRVQVINLELKYSQPKAFPAEQRISINQSRGAYESLDHSFRMIESRELEGDAAHDIFVLRRFLCEDWARDYGEVTLLLEITSEQWKGIKQLRLQGKLEPGGRLVPQEIALN